MFACSRTIQRSFHAPLPEHGLSPPNDSVASDTIEKRRYGWLLSEQYFNRLLIDLFLEAKVQQAIPLHRYHHGTMRWLWIFERDSHLEISLKQTPTKGKKGDLLVWRDEIPLWVILRPFCLQYYIGIKYIGFVVKWVPLKNCGKSKGYWI